MATTINASTSAGLVSTADTSGVLQLQTAGTTALTVNTTGAIGVGTSPSYGTSGQVLTSAGSAAAPTWSTVSASPGGSTTQVQYNNAGAFAGSANMTFDGSSLTVNTVKIGVGAGATSNLAIGANTLTSASIGANNIAIGSGAAQNSTGIQITTIGQGAAPNTTGNNSVYIGQTCATTATSGTYNVIIGQAACGGAVGVALTSGGQNTVIGGSANVSSATAAGQIVLGFSVAGQADNNVTIGNNAGKIYNAYTVNATWTQTSDGRLKTNVKDDSLGLSFINRLRPVTFNWKASNQIDPSLPYYNEVNQRDTTTVIHGLIAQEVKAALDAEGCSTFNGWDAGNEDTIQAISREMFISPLIKAMQELSEKLDAANAANAALASRIATLEAK